MYNPPSNKLQTLIEEISPIIEDAPNNTLVVVDFNIDASKEQMASLQLLSIMNSFGLSLCSKIPTRPGDGTNSLIDHVYTNNSTKALQIDNIHNDLSDHNFLLVSLETNNVSPGEGSPSHTSSVNPKLLNGYLASNKFTIEEAWDAELSYSKFIDYFNKGIELSTVHYHRKDLNRGKYAAPWIDEEYPNRVKREESLFAVKKKHKSNNQILEDYKSVRNTVTALQRIKKRNHYSKLLEKPQDQIKNLWKVANQVLYNKSNVGNQEIKLPTNGVPGIIQQLRDLQERGGEGVQARDHG